MDHTPDRASMLVWLLRMCLLHAASSATQQYLHGGCDLHEAIQREQNSIKDPVKAWAIFEQLGLDTVEDVLHVHLDASEYAELRLALQVGGLTLGDRTRLRRLFRISGSVQDARSGSLEMGEFIGAPGKSLGEEERRMLQGSENGHLSAGVVAMLPKQ